MSESFIIELFLRGADWEMSLLIGNENDASKLLSVSQHLLHYRGLSFDKAIENKRHWISSNEPNLSFFGSMSAIKIPSLAFMKKNILKSVDEISVQFTGQNQTIPFVNWPFEVKETHNSTNLYLLCYPTQ